MIARVLIPASICFVGLAIGTASHAAETVKWRVSDFGAIYIGNSEHGATADLILIGSHGRRGIEGLLLGSQAIKLLTHTKNLSLVVR